MKSLRLIVVLCLVVVILWEPVEARKSRGGSSRGSGKPSRGSSRRQPAPAPAPAPAPSPNLNHGGLASLSYPGYNSPPARKPSAPESPKHTDTKPVGWNVNNRDTAIKKDVSPNAQNTPTNTGGFAQPAPAYPAGGGLSGQSQGAHGYPAGSGLSGQSHGAPAYSAGGGLSGAQPGHAAPAYPAGSGLSGAAGGQGAHAYPASGGLSGTGSHGYPAGGAQAQPAYPAGSGLSGAGQHGYPASSGLSGAGHNQPPAYSPGYNNPPAYQPHNQAGYGNVGNNAYNRGPPAPGYGGAAPGYGGAAPGYGGYGGAPAYGGYGGYGGQGGYGGYGGGAFPGYGGMGGFGGGGFGGMSYARQKPSFLSGNKFGLILAGLAVWNLARSGSRTTHNHYHNTYNNADPAHPMPAENVTDPVLGELTNCTLTIASLNETSIIRIPCVIATSFAPSTKLEGDANKPPQGDQPGALNCTITVVTKNGTEVKTDISCEELSNLAPKNVTIPDDPLADPAPPQTMNCVNRMDPNGQPCGPTDPNVNMGEAPLEVIPLSPVTNTPLSPVPEGPTSTTIFSIPMETPDNTTPTPA